MIEFRILNHQLQAMERTLKMVKSQMVMNRVQKLLREIPQAQKGFLVVSKVFLLLLLLIEYAHHHLNISLDKKIY